MKQQMVYKSLMKCFLLLTQSYYTFLLAQFYCQLFLHILLLINELLFFILTFTITRIPDKIMTTFFTTIITTIKHSHLLLSLFHFCLLLQTTEFNLHSHLQLSCHFIYFVPLRHDPKLNTFRFMFLTTFGIHNPAYG